MGLPKSGYVGRRRRGGIARMLSVADAAILDAYAIECEAEARIAEQKLLIAA